MNMVKDPVCGMNVDEKKAKVKPTISVFRAASPPLKRTQPNSLSKKGNSFFGFTLF